VALAAAACGSDEGESGSTTTTAPAAGAESTAETDTPETTESAEPTAPADTTAPAVEEGTLGTKNPAVGDPVLVGAINGTSSDTQGAVARDTNEGYAIAIKYANDYMGGIGGRPIKLVTCDDKGTPAGATDCAQQLIQENVDFFISVRDPFESEKVKLLSEAGIPQVWPAVATLDGLTAPGVFAMNGGAVTSFGAMAVKAQELGVTKFAMITIDVPAAVGSATNVGSIPFAKLGIDYEVIAVAPGTPDMTPQLQTAITGGADALGVVGNTTFCTAFFQAYQTLGLTAEKFSLGPCLDSTVVAAVPTTLAGTYVATGRAPGPDDELYAATIDEYAEREIDPDPNLSVSVADGWSALINLARAMEGFEGELSADASIGYIRTHEGITMALLGESTATCDSTAVPIFPNICSGDVYLGRSDESGILQDGEILDTSSAFAE
jgi:branched-chain amino acid transport system substrate-binding protein